MSDGKNLILNWYLDALQFFRQLSLVTFGSHPCCWQMMMILSNFSLMHLWMVSGQVWHCHYCTPWEFLFSEPAYVTDGVFVYLYLLELKPIIHLNCKSFTSQYVFENCFILTNIMKIPLNIPFLQIIFYCFELRCFFPQGLRLWAFFFTISNYTKVWKARAHNE